MNRPKKLRSLSAIAVAGALVLAACGDDGNDTADAPERPSEDIVEVASTTDGFATLVSAVGAAGLVETLQGDGPFTVFAPTDDAFAALPDGLLDSLLEPENEETLQRILTYHVVGAEVLAADVEAGSVETVEGNTIEITTDDGVMVNDANVVQTDVLASNGVIHVIDAVILPPDIAASL